MITVTITRKSGKIETHTYSAFNQWLYKRVLQSVIYRSMVITVQSSGKTWDMTRNDVLGAYQV